jgi:D-inositol-3-phosphate glycosyltransferase
MPTFLLRSGAELLAAHDCVGSPRALLAVLRARLQSCDGERSAGTLTLAAPSGHDGPAPRRLVDDVAQLAPVVVERTAGADLVHALDLVAAAAALAARRTTGVPVVVRDQPAVRQRSSGSLSAAWSAVLRAADGVLVPTAQDAHAAQGAGVEPARITVCPDGALVASAQCGTLVDGPAGAPSQRYLLGLSGVPERAAVREGLVATLRLDPTLRLVLAGTEEAPGSRRALLELARHHGTAERIELHDPLPSPEVLDLVDGAAAVVSTRSDPSSALSALVAMRRARPVVGVHSVAASDVLVDGVTGRLVAADEPRRLAEVLVSTATDRFRQLSWGLAGLDRVASRYDGDAVMAAVVRAYEQAA